ncbi:DUF934 domain-containing protein [Mangrovibrevibacter kandeliae]|uniref:DUF934 domain-containing protein n=1 Tax=Mangrovibrevibacter kandeliae TaxID=2968473 RepID=UPI002118881F|nr:DUF934 domain-containing protein [Aurantimonas sp. CSK15Z-1]MCQ8781970.1 DUF934 domain-containing protein [Aurantimonas sp. CSK15Z-1]
MTVVTPTGEVPNDYVRIESADDLTTVQGPLLAPLALAGAAVEARRNDRLGLSVANDTKVDAIAPFFDAIDLIAVEFPSFSDGRGLSLAKRLRRAGFAGRLRASGPLIADQFAEALACGFDEIQLPETMAARQPVAQWLAAKDIVTEHYQSGYGADRSILQKRLAARKG